MRQSVSNHYSLFSNQLTRPACTLLLITQLVKVAISLPTLSRQVHLLHSELLVKSVFLCILLKKKIKGKVAQNIHEDEMFRPPGDHGILRRVLNNKWV